MKNKSALLAVALAMSMSGMSPAHKTEVKVKNPESDWGKIKAAEAKRQRRKIKRRDLLGNNSI